MESEVYWRGYGNEKKYTNNFLITFEHYAKTFYGTSQTSHSADVGCYCLWGQIPNLHPNSYWGEFSDRTQGCAGSCNIAKKASTTFILEDHADGNHVKKITGWSYGRYLKGFGLDFEEGAYEETNLAGSWSFKTIEF